MRKFLLALLTFALCVPVMAQTGMAIPGCATIHNGICESRGFGLGLDTNFTKPSVGTVKVGGAYNYATVQVGRLKLMRLDTPATPTIAFTGTQASTSYAYKVSCYSADGSTTAASAASTTYTTGSASLSAANYFTVTFVRSPGSNVCQVFRTTGGAAQGWIANVAAPGTTLVDTGLVAETGVTAPTINTTGELLLADINDTPATAGAACTKGEVRFGSAGIYVCTATDTWKMVAIATWSP